MATAPLMQQARIAIREGRLVDARRLLRQVIHEEPLNHVAWLLLAKTTPDKMLAAEYIERARQLQPDSPLVQDAAENLASNKNTGSNRRRFSWHLAPVLVGIALLFGLAYLSFGGGSWEQVTALQSNGVESVAAAPVEALQNKPEQVKRTKPGTGEPAPIDSVAISTRESKEDADSPLTLPTATISKDSTSAEEPVEDSNKEQEPNHDSQAVSDADQGLPAAILMGIETEASSGDEEDSIAAADETIASSQEGTGESEINDATEIQQEMQDLAEAESESVVEETTAAFDPAAPAPGERWIDVNLTTQTLVAYEGDAPVLHSVISSGLWQFPTVTGQYNTWIKYESQNMTGYHLGYNYEIPDVPYVMYFFEDYAIHGAYWHNNFGTPMSHGCVNMNVGDAEWLFNWAPLGTTVNVHD